MPHYQEPGRPIFVTFCELIRDPFPDGARDVILAHCQHDDGKRIVLHAAVVMPDHVHLLLMAAGRTGLALSFASHPQAHQGRFGTQCQ
jgi:hypothetical protein